jgi:argininosuccinate synthase
MADVAKEVVADAVSYGCIGKGNDELCLLIQVKAKLKYCF